MKGYEDHKRRYPALDPAQYGYAWPNADYYRRPQLLITCPVCQSQQNITPQVSQKASDMAPILKHFRTASEVQWKQAHPLRAYLTIERGIIAGLVVALLILIIL